MTLDAWRGREVAVIGLGKSGRAASQLLARHGARVYASDAADAPAVREAAAALRAAGVDAQSGAHDLERIARAAAVVASPGVPPSAPPLARASAAGVPVVGEIEVALRALPRLRYIAVTGTNGKTTTTALIGHLLRGLGHEALDLGNIGTPLAELALAARQPDWVALEMSSFQLHDTPSVQPAVGVVTNLSPDHLDRYPSVDEYYADKALLFRNASRESRWVLFVDQAEVLRLHCRVLPCDGGIPTPPGTTMGFSLEHSGAQAYYDRQREVLLLFGEPILPRRELVLLGDHNVANALAALLAVSLADPAHRTAEARGQLAAALRSFRALPHRLEIVGEHGGVLWVNDSKATNVSSALVAIEAMTRPAVVLLGGRHKGEPYTALAEPLRRVAKRVVAYGEAAPIIVGDLARSVPVERVDGDFSAVVARARAAAAPGDVVLLSPACSSYDMFNNYEERGAEFSRLAAAGA